MTLLYVIAITIAISQQLSAAQDNTYSFSYNTQGEGPANIFREERRNPDGSVVGKYGYVDPNGQLRVVEYRANGPDEFQARGDIGPDSESMKVWQANLAEHERARADFMQQWQAAARSPPQPAWSSQPSASPRSSWNPPAAAPAPRSWNPPRDTPARAPRPTWNSNPQPAPAPGPRTSPRLTNSWSQSRTQPPQATTSWDDGNGGTANVWSTGSAYQSFVDSTGDNNNNNQRFNRRVGQQSSIAGPRQRNTAASASPSFNWPEMPNGPQPLRNADSASHSPYSYGFQIEHGPATNAKASAGGVSSTYASGYNN